MSEASDLTHLQECDLELLRIRARLDAMPQRTKLAQIAEATRAVSSRLVRVVGRRKDLEMEMDDLRQRRDSLDAKAREVREQAQGRAADFRATNDLEAQLTSLAKRVEKVEFTLSGDEDELRRVRAAEEKGEGLRARLEEERRATQQSFEEESASLRGDAVRLEADAASARARLPQDVLDRYDAAAKRFSGLAVETLHGNVPSICRVRLQPGAFQRLARGPVIAECPYCHRILVTEEVSDE